MSEDEKKDSLEDDFREMEAEDKEYEWLEENEELEESEPQETENPEEKENLEESEGESIQEFLAREEEDTIRQKKTKILDLILKELEDTEFFSFLHEHRELENLLKMFVFALTQLADGTLNVDQCVATAKREADIVKVEYEFFDSDGNRVYFEQDGTISKIFSSKSEKP